jgi:hypothetical protein
VVRVKGDSHRESTQGESWKTALNLTKLGQKAAHKKNTSMLIRRSYSFSLFLEVMLKKGVVDDNDDE